jgi:hypothetical protein
VTIDKFWLDAPEYSLVEAAYIVCDHNPESITEGVPQKVLNACRQMKAYLVSGGRAYSDTHPRKILVTNDFVREWADYFQETDFFNPEPLQIDKPLTESKRDKLLKQIGVMALVLAEAKGKYKKGEKPNASQIAEAVQLVTDAFEFPGKIGTGSTEIRDSIRVGLKLLQEED